MKLAIHCLVILQMLIAILPRHDILALCNTEFVQVSFWTLLKLSDPSKEDISMSQYIVNSLHE